MTEDREKLGKTSSALLARLGSINRGGTVLVDFSICLWVP